MTRRHKVQGLMRVSKAGALFFSLSLVTTFVFISLEGTYFQTTFLLLTYRNMSAISSFQLLSLINFGFSLPTIVGLCGVVEFLPLCSHVPKNKRKRKRGLTNTS